MNKLLERQQNWCLNELSNKEKNREFMVEVKPRHNSLERNGLPFEVHIHNVFSVQLAI